eukprot:7747448-Pyramimonas_sp.AAC.1
MERSLRFHVISLRERLMTGAFRRLHGSDSHDRRCADENTSTTRPSCCSRQRRGIPHGAS